MSKTHVLKVRITEEERKTLQDAASKNNTSLSEEIRRRLFVPQKEVVPQKVVPQTKKAANIVPQSADIPAWKVKLEQQLANKKAK